ncbi:MAG TPA: MarR family winged helix-turn-helix transcriptional regulator [Ktedonobacteraceae bacterium]|jgi:DNA-binding MarR family transcriptional regulator
MSEQIDSEAVQRCANANIRRTNRMITQFYDAILAPSGLNGSQFGLLATLREAAPITINNLAELIDMDRTTLTRNLDVLMKRHLILSRPGDDRRMRLVFVSQEGDQALQLTWPLWQEAQTSIEQAFGRERFEALLKELAAIRAVVR